MSHKYTIAVHELKVGFRADFYIPKPAPEIELPESDEESITGIAAPIDPDEVIYAEKIETLARRVGDEIKAELKKK